MTHLNHNVKLKIRPLTYYYMLGVATYSTEKKILLKRILNTGSYFKYIKGRLISEGMGEVFSQVGPEGEKVVAYFIQVHNKYERSYAITNPEQ